MADFNVRSDSVDVEQIMKQIRARIREKRGADYTEAELQQLAKVKLESFLDPRGVRSDLVEQFRRHRPVTPGPKPFVLEELSLYGTHRSGLRWIRSLLNPLLKLFFNPNQIAHSVNVTNQALREQMQMNDEVHRRFTQREAMDPLYYEVVHNLVVEMTRLGIEVHNLKMRVESLSSRMDFDERRARSLERVVEYRPGTLSRPPAQDPAPAQPPALPGAAAAPAEGARPDGMRPPGDGERRRRRRRRRRRPGQTLADSGSTGSAGPTGSSGAEGPAGPAGSPGTSGAPAAPDERPGVDDQSDEEFDVDGAADQ
jgi:hypothetical protein